MMPLTFREGKYFKRKLFEYKIIYVFHGLGRLFVRKGQVWNAYYATVGEIYIYIYIYIYI